MNVIRGYLQVGEVLAGAWSGHRQLRDAFLDLPWLASDPIATNEDYHTSGASRTGWSSLFRVA